MSSFGSPRINHVLFVLLGFQMSWWLPSFDRITVRCLPFCCWNDLESSRCTFPLLLQDTVNGATADGKAPCYRLNGHITLTGLRFLVEYAYTGSLEVPGDMVS